MIFSTTESIVIPEGKVVSISKDSETLWKKHKYKKKLAYIESAGPQYIDTGVVGKSGVRAFLDFEFVSGSFADFIIFGSSAGNGTTTWTNRFYPVSARDDEWVLGYGNRIHADIVPKMGQRYAVESELSVGKQTMTVDGLTVISDTLTKTINNKQSMYLFGVNYVGKFKEYGGSRVYSCWIEVDGVLVRDFIPVLDMNDVPCMYDKVSGEFFYNKGTGKFTYEDNVVVNEI